MNIEGILSLQSWIISLFFRTLICIFCFFPIVNFSWGCFFFFLFWIFLGVPHFFSILDFSWGASCTTIYNIKCYILKLTKKSKLNYKLKNRLINWSISLMSRVFAHGLGGRGSIPGRVIPKTQKIVLDAALLNTQHYKICIKGKKEQSRKWSSTFPYILEKGAFWSPSTKVANFTLLLFILESKFVWVVGTFWHLPRHVEWLLISLEIVTMIQVLVYDKAVFISLSHNRRENSVLQSRRRKTLNSNRQYYA